ncbi:MAG: gluconate 2-dehydrogenase subunit 3 family protein [Saprospiraceae bacterium]|jgi:hypothetical protein
MDRRDSFKTILVGTMAGGMLLQSCQTNEEKTALQTSLDNYQYGRTKKEKEHDNKILAESFFTDHEMKTISVLGNLILPPNEIGSIEKAGVPDFIEFMAKDYPPFQVPLRGGLKNLDRKAQALFSSNFIDCSTDQQKSILDEMAWPIPDVPMSGQTTDVQFFNQIKNLTLTGYYTSRVGFDDLGYVGNIPNVWDGVPQEVLDQYDVDYEPEWLAKCIDQSTREEVAEWDEEGNLLN